MTPATRRSAPRRPGGAATGRRRTRRARTTSIATGDRAAPRSLALPLGGEVAQQLLRVLDVLVGELSRLDEVRHHRLRFSAEEPEQIVDEPPLRGFARQR